MTAAVLYPLLTACAYYLGARANVTRWLWSRYPSWLDGFMVCAACTGFWYGLGVAGVGWWLELDFLTLPARHWTTPLLVGLCSVVWTPVVSWLHVAALEQLGAPFAPGEDDNADQT